MDKRSSGDQGQGSTRDSGVLSPAEGLGLWGGGGLTTGLESGHVESLQGADGRGRLRSGRTGGAEPAGMRGACRPVPWGAPSGWERGCRPRGRGEPQLEQKKAATQLRSIFPRRFIVGDDSHEEPTTDTDRQTLTTPLSTQSTQGASKGEGKPDSSWPRPPTTCSPRASFPSAGLLSLWHRGPWPGVAARRRAQCGLSAPGAQSRVLPPAVAFGRRQCAGRSVAAVLAGCCC